MSRLLRTWRALSATALLATGLLTGCASGGVPADLDPVSSPEWATDMARFAAEDAETPPPERPIVFTGSSSVRMWERLAADFPDVPVLNRGFGGSQVRDAIWYADEVALRYRPRQIVLYAGDNDIAEGRSAAQVLADTQAFVTRIRAAQPGTPIALLGIKPSPSRANLLDVQRDANNALRDWAATQRNIAYIDVFTPMLDAEGVPREDLFIADRLHMNAAGYAMWRKIIGPYLVR
ncbi:SGNH/GDSL hydrolase family protein [Luteimonas sp. 3794]|uniref:SGNH/GDSL hydrolase family protein n=1 Tax=Luteimonas sp. 3794 TaxID=2817730 RepID=UPI00285EC266|nr:SGNH/GDSL hydrolase family protein [Luteimonas sp. 3794]MDR6991262.1 lysophospholipase L1-like esterase [Luteimonas sp. 3794]